MNQIKKESVNDANSFKNYEIETKRKPTIHVVDEIMSRGKTSAAINYINSLPSDTKIMFVTPYNNKEKDSNGNYKNCNEIARIIQACPSKNFKEPEEYPRKIDSIKWLLRKGKNIATTHSLFSMFDDEIIELCYSQEYILFLDEVTNVVEPYTDMSTKDLEMLKKDEYVSVDPETKLLIWNEDKEYHGKFLKEKIMCKNQCLAIYGNNISLWLFPVKIFKAFKEAYILTYLFEAQMQKYYYDYNKIEYDYMYVNGNSYETYTFSTVKDEIPIKYDYKKLIHIVDNEKLNLIGDLSRTLSKSWYRKHGSDITNSKEKDELMKILQLNTYNFFNNIVPNRKAGVLWTTFKDFKKDLKGNGYTKGFLSHNVRATNAYKHCHNVAYLINKFINPLIKNFFIMNGIPVNEDGYALSEMLQFIWRSAIREGEEIYLYTPSKRMRELLIRWIEEHPMNEEVSSNE